MERAGVSLYIAFVTDGGASHPSHPVVSPNEIAARRKAEACLAAGILGVNRNQLTFLEAPDGELAQLGVEPRKQVVAAISVLLSKVSPEAILLPCRHDGSSEHDAAFLLVCSALEQSGLQPRIFEFPVWSWWNPFLLLKLLVRYRRVWRVDLGEDRAAKARAVASYVSQTLPIPPDTKSALPQGFADMFLGSTEFFFEQ
jgi:LmbE family N-acetylglucosaminyl deacetylase